MYSINIMGSLPTDAAPGDETIAIAAARSLALDPALGTVAVASASFPIAGAVDLLAPDITPPDIAQLEKTVRDDLDPSVAVSDAQLRTDVAAFLDAYDALAAVPVDPTVPPVTPAPTDTTGGDTTDGSSTPAVTATDGTAVAI